MVTGQRTAQRSDGNSQPSPPLSFIKWWNRKALRRQPQQAISKPSTFENSPKLDLMIQEQLHKLNSVLAGGDVNALLRFCAPDIRLDAPGRPGVLGHGRELVFALHTFFETKARRSVILEDLIQLQLVHLKGQNDPGKEWFLLTRNNFPLQGNHLVQEAGKAMILWQLVPGVAQSADSSLDERDDAGGQLMIRWWIWNDDGDAASAQQKDPTAEGRAERTLSQKKDENSKSIKLLYSSLHDRWSDFNRALIRGDFDGCLDFTSPDTVIMPPGNPALRGADLELVCEAFVQAGVTQHVTINEAFLFKGRRIVPWPGESSYTKVKYFVLENDAFTNTYIQSNESEAGKQVIFWELHREGSDKDENIGLTSFPLHKGSLKWGWTLWNSNSPESR